MMSSSRAVTAASRSPSSSTRLYTVSFAWATARSRKADSVSARILNVISFAPGPLVSDSSVTNFFWNRSSSLPMSAGSVNCTRMSAVSGVETWTLASSFCISSWLRRPSPECTPSDVASSWRISSAKWSRLSRIASSTSTV